MAALPIILFEKQGIFELCKESGCVVLAISYLVMESSGGLEGGGQDEACRLVSTNWGCSITASIAIVFCYLNE